MRGPYTNHTGAATNPESSTTSKGGIPTTKESTTSKGGPTTTYKSATPTEITTISNYSTSYGATWP